MSTHFHVSGTGVTGPLAGLSSNYKWWVLVTAIFGAFVSILDITIVNTALPQIQRAFGSDLHVASYVATAYTLAQGVIMAASGFLATRFGIKRMYLLSLALFTLGSVLCGLAWNSTILILFRVLQGAGGAALFPLSLSLIFGAFSEEQRGLANGIFGIPVLVGGIAVGINIYLISRWATLTSPFALLVPLLIVQGLTLPSLVQTTGTAALTGIGGAALPGANTLLSVSRVAISSLALAGLVNLVQAQRLVHQAGLAAHGPVSVAITRQAQALAYQDVFLLTALATLPILVLALFLRSQRRTQKKEETTTFGVSPQTPEAAIETR